MWPYKNIAIVGLSVEGLDCALFFAKQGAQITCCDRRVKEELGEIYRKLEAITGTFRLGKDYLSDFGKFDLIVRTPGMLIRTPELVAASGKIPITSLTKLFFEYCKAPIIGVTGTKGKGTTASLIAEMLEKEGKRVWLGGNVGVPLLSKVQTIAPTDVVVLELSSFQLEDLTASPQIAVVLKITQDHLANFDPLATNYHESREAYVEAKRSIVRYQKEGDSAICNADDPTSSSFARETKGRVYYFSRTKQSADAFVESESVWLVQGDTKQLVCRADEIQLIGVHNLENIAAATLAASLAGASIESIRSTARAFKGLEHRLEYVREAGGISYYNDSFSTVPETTIAAIQSFHVPIILIVGGSEKGSDFAELGREITRSTVKVLIVIGGMTARILKAVREAKYKGEIVCDLHSMKEIVAFCQRKAKEGDVVLLSPACASFDMFKNYKERGILFKQEVLRL